MADNDLLSLAEARTAINIGVSVDHDTELQLFLSGISERIDDLCGPVVVRTITGEEYDGGRPRILLESSPVNSVTTVTEYQGTTAVTLTAETNSTKPADAYKLVHVHNLSFLYRRASNSDKDFFPGRGNIVATYVAGRVADTASVEEKFKLACSAVLRRMWKREQSSWAHTPEFFSDTEDPRSSLSGFFRAIDPMVKEMLANEIRSAAA